MHFMEVLNPDNIGALFFVDDNMKPKVIKLTIANVTCETPPVGKKGKACFYFKEIAEKKCFLASGEVKKIARTLRVSNTDMWIGAVLSITCAQKRLGNKDVMGMVIVEINGKAV